MSDIEQLKPKLKSNLRFGLQSHGGEGCCVIEDSASEQFWRLGIDEFRFASLMDGRRTVAEILQQLRTNHSPPDFDQDEVQTILAWLAHEGLLDNLSSTNPAPAPRQAWIAGLNRSVFFRLRLGSPQALLERIYPVFGFLTHPLLGVVWLVLCLAAVLTVIGRWGEFQASTLNVIAPDQWLYFVLIWWGLKAVHELFHGLTCLRYGGNVRESGILFILFAPLGAYVDVTSAWRFNSKWKRLHVTIAGIYVELLIAAIAIIVWSVSSDPLIRQTCLQIVILASVATVLFNANPLIRFDGYYLLADLLELPNLYQRGQIAINRLGTRFFYGERHSQSQGQTYRRGFVLLYGMASFVWRIFLSISILIAAATLLEGPGLLLAGGLAAAWFIVPVIMTLWRAIVRIRKKPLQVARAIGIVSALAGISFFVVTQIKIPQTLVVPGVVQPYESTLIRASTSGRLEGLAVLPGDHVRAEQVIGRIDNPELAIKLLERRQELARTEMRIRRLRVLDHIGELQAEQQVALNLSQQIQVLEKEEAQLVIRAPHAGVVANFDLDGLVGQYVTRGAPLLEIADVSELEFSFSVVQEQVGAFNNESSDKTEAKVFVAGYWPQQAPVSSLEIQPQATWGLQDAALAAVNGGPVPVVSVSDDQTTVGTLHPRWQGSVQLPENSPLHPGSVGSLRLTLDRQTLAEILKPQIRRTATEFVNKLRGQTTPN